MIFAAVALALVGLGEVSEKEVGAFAVERSKGYVDDMLKSPSTAKYGVKRIEKAEPSAVHVQGRYLVYGSVDASNSFGAIVRGSWLAVVRVDGESPELLAVLWTGEASSDEDEMKALYAAPADRRYRPEIIKRVKDDLKVYGEKYRKQAERVPLKKRQAFLERAVLQFVNEGKRYGLTAVEMEDIINN